MRKTTYLICVLFAMVLLTQSVSAASAYEILSVMPSRIDSWPGQPTPPTNPGYPIPPTYPPSNPSNPGYPGNGNYESAQDLLNAGQQFYNQGNFYSAVQSLRRLLDRYPYDYRAGQACFLTAEAYRKLQDYSSSITFYRKVTTSYHQYYQVDRAAYYIGFCYVKLNNYYSAATELRNFTIQYNTSQLVDDAWYVLGRTYETLNDRTNAINAYQTVVYNYPQSEFYARSRDRLSILQGQGDTNQPPYYPPNPGYPTPPTYPGYPMPSLSDQELYDRGHTKLAQGNYNNAVTYFEELRKLYPNSQYADDALLWIAKARYEQRNYIDAIQSFEKFNRYYAGSNLYYDSLFGLAYAEYKLALTNASYRSYFTRSANNFAYFQQSFSSHKWASEALFMTGECNERIGNYTNAKYYYQQVVDYYPNTPSAIQARQKLGQIFW